MRRKRIAGAQAGELKGMLVSKDFHGFAEFDLPCDFAKR
jgi:hypothetical protein